MDNLPRISGYIDFGKEVFVISRASENTVEGTIHGRRFSASMADAVLTKNNLLISFHPDGTSTVKEIVK